MLIQFGVGGVVADQLGITHQHHGLGDACEGQQARFDFFRFHTETAQLDLLIEAPEVFEDAIGVPARTVTGAIQPSARRAQRVGDKTFGRQPGTAQVTPRQADTADAQFARHTGR